MPLDTFQRVVLIGLVFAVGIVLAVVFEVWNRWVDNLDVNGQPFLIGATGRHYPFLATAFTEAGTGP